jgi:hypothetical protein
MKLTKRGGRSRSYEDEMATNQADEECVRFSPPEVDGLPDVSEVAIFPDRLEVLTAGRWIAFWFDSIGRKQESRAASWLKRLLGRAPWPTLVGEREFCTSRRYVAFYTSPKLKIYTPADSDVPYGETFIFRINAVLAKRGYSTCDLS